MLFRSDEKDRILKLRMRALWSVCGPHLNREGLYISRSTWEDTFAGEWSIEKVNQMRKWSKEQWAQQFVR